MLSFNANYHSIYCEIKKNCAMTILQLPILMLMIYKSILMSECLFFCLLNFNKI